MKHLLLSIRYVYGLAAIITSATCNKNNAPAGNQPPSSTVKYGLTLKADGPGSTYELIASAFGGDPLEDPDCAHPAFGRHVSEVFDPVLNENVFVFTIHVTPDNDRCNGSTDRQRNEIKTYGPSPDSLKGQLNETVTYRWKFKLDAGFQSSPSFTHIHQVKAGDGNNDAPIITITPRAGTPEKLEIIHTGNSAASSLGKVKTVDLAPFKDTWVEVTEKVVYKTKGSIDLVIKRVSDGATLLAYANNNLDMWRDSTTFCRPKWGIYRSLNNVPYLRDEEVRFADFCIAEGDAVCR
jgi:hypothetical protein